MRSALIFPKGDVNNISPLLGIFWGEIKPSCPHFKTV